VNSCTMPPGSRAAIAPQWGQSYRVANTLRRVLPLSHRIGAFRLLPSLSAPKLCPGITMFIHRNLPIADNAESRIHGSAIARCQPIAMANTCKARGAAGGLVTEVQPSPLLDRGTRHLIRYPPKRPDRQRANDRGR
jgi:hypothetical protein